jgi:hypothetical protein
MIKLKVSLYNCLDAPEDTLQTEICKAYDHLLIKGLLILGDAFEFNAIWGCIMHFDLNS